MITSIDRRWRRRAAATFSAAFLALASAAFGYSAVASAAPLDCSERAPNDFTPCCVDSGAIATPSNLCDDPADDGLLGNLPVVGNLPGVGGVL